jgi:hypothetical protein
MKFTIEVEGFWLEDDQLQPALTRHIISDVVSQIHKSMKSKIDEHIAKEAHAQVEKSMYFHINAATKELCESGTISKNGKQVLLKDYIKSEFENNSGWRSPEEILKQLAKKFGDEMKQRYDLMFASQIVIKLKENGLLKEDAAKMLLSDPLTR